MRDGCPLRAAGRRLPTGCCPCDKPQHDLEIARAPGGLPEFVGRNAAKRNPPADPAAKADRTAPFCALNLCITYKSH